MTLLFSRAPGDQPATHAFVIGVGGYSSAKAGQGSLPDLLAPDVPSAADSAKFFCDWLLRNCDLLVDPLATLEVLISDSAEGEDRYDWNPPLPEGHAPPAAIDEATAANVLTAGEAWLHDDRVRNGDTVLFYFCGHGASLSSEPALFLGDLNLGNKPWKFMNVQSLGRSLKQNCRIGNAYLFVDACGELIPGFDLHVVATRDPGLGFWPEVRWAAQELWKVLLLCATPAGLSAFDGDMTGSSVRLGRFTQTLVKALDGALVGDWDGRWAVNSASLSNQLKNLREFCFPGWNDHPFDPGALMSFNEVRHIVVPARPMVPVRARVSPKEAFDGHSLCIGEEPPPPIPGNASFPFDTFANVWRPEIPPSTSARYAVVHKGDVFHVLHFTPNKPHFDLKVPIT